MSLRSDRTTAGGGPSSPPPLQPTPLTQDSLAFEAGPSDWSTRTDSRVAVVYRKRKALDADAPPHLSAHRQADEPKAPRVFVVPAAEPQAEASSDAQSELPSEADAEVPVDAAETPAPLRRRRRRLDPSRAPGEVTRVVFATQPRPPKPVEQPAPRGWPFADDRADHQALGRALDELQALVADARRARAFKLG